MDYVAFGIGVDPASDFPFESHEAAVFADRDGGVHLLDVFEGSQQGSKGIHCLFWSQMVVELVQRT